MAVALDLHELRDVDRPRLADATEVVAREVDQHDVLRTLLGVGQQFLTEHAVLVGVRSTSTRASDRPCLHAPALDLHERLRRRADDVRLSRVDQVEVRRRVDDAQDPVEVERIDVGPDTEALAEHRLERVTGDDVLLDPPDRLEIRAVDHVRGDLGQTGRALRRSDRCVPSPGQGEALQHGLVRLVGRPMGRTQRVIVETGGDHVRHDGHHLLQMVERDDVAWEGEDGVRQAEVVGHGLREALDLAHHVEAQVADGPAMQRHTGQRRRGQQAEQDVERVEQPDVTPDAVRESSRELALDRHLPSAAAQDEEGIEADERVAPPALPMLRGLQQERRPIAPDEVVHAQRGVQIGQDTARDRDDTMLTCERDELLG